MKKLVLLAAVSLALWSCDYSVKSNGNIDDAYAHEVKTEEAPAHGEAAHETHTTEAVADTAKATSQDSLRVEAAEAHH